MADILSDKTFRTEPRENCVNHRTVGVSLAMSPDGKNLAFGCPFHNRVELYLLPEDGGIEYWNAQPVFHGLYLERGDRFGASVAITEEIMDGVGETVLAVGAPGRSFKEGDETIVGAGAVFVNKFSRPLCQDCLGSWQFPFTARATVPSQDANFGQEFNLSPDGLSLVVGVPSGESGNGAVYVFSRSTIHVRWEEMETIFPVRAESQLFGSSLSLSANGKVLALGAPGNSSGASGVGNEAHDFEAPGSGAVYVYKKSAGRWQLKSFVKPPNTKKHMELGASVALSADGNTLVVGAPGARRYADGGEGDNEDSESGAAYIY